MGSGLSCLSTGGLQPRARRREAIAACVASHSRSGLATHDAMADQRLARVRPPDIGRKEKHAASPCPPGIIEIARKQGPGPKANGIEKNLGRVSCQTMAGRESRLIPLGDPFAEAKSQGRIPGFPTSPGGPNLLPVACRLLPAKQHSRKPRFPRSHAPAWERLKDAPASRAERARQPQPFSKPSSCPSCIGMKNAKGSAYG